MNKSLNDVDPLMVFRCKNRLCHQIFTPSTLLNDNTKKVTFECPLCGSRYEASYSDINLNPNHQAIMLLEFPKLTYLGTKVASS